jgi:hypothetical protein
MLHKIEFDLPNTYKFHKKSKICRVIFIENAVTQVVLVRVDCSKKSGVVDAVISLDSLKLAGKEDRKE